MKNKFLYTIIFIFALGVVFSVVQARNFISYEKIKNFKSEIKVNKDNSVDVSETIVYDSGNEEKHGIFRNLRLLSSQDRFMRISNLEVMDEKGQPYIFETQENGENLEIKIGNPEQTFSGEKTYRISYRAERAVGQYEDLDEIYWNVTGNDWGMPIDNAEASVSLPGEAEAMQISCYQGPARATKTCDAVEVNHQYVFSSEPLNPFEGLTLAVGFPKGFVSAYSKGDEVASFWNKYGGWILAFLVPLLSLIFSLWYWWKYGRDPKGRGTIVPEYEAPKDLTPLEIAGIMRQKTAAKDISAEIIYLATKGHLKINHIEKTTLGVFKSTDYELIKIKDLTPNENFFDQRVMTGLFNGKDKILVSELKNNFYSELMPINKAVMEGLLAKGYYKKISKTNPKIITAWTGIFVLMLILPVNFQFGAFVGVVVGLLVHSIVALFFPVKTEKGVLAKEYILGLKDYLEIAEKDRLHFHNAPEKKPELFEKLLPYAMVLGVAKIWAKEFEGIYMAPPSWYGGNPAAFNAVVFSNELGNFSSFAGASFSSTPGSSGGGFSGGGGGGGGGGSW